MKNLSPELKVGLFALLVIILLAFMTIKISGVMSWWGKGYRVYVVFDNISGLDEKSRIKIAGVDAGIVERIRLKEGRAELTLLINPDVRIYRDATASLRVAGFLGDKYLSVSVGSSSEPRLKDGDVIIRVERPIDIDALAAELTSASARVNDLADAVVKIFGESERKALVSTIHNLNDITANLDEILREGKEPFKTTVAKMEKFSISLGDKGPGLIDDIGRAAKELRAFMEENRPALKQSVENIKGFSESAENIAQKVDRGEGTLGKLLKDDKLYDSLSNVADGISKGISTVDNMKTFIDFRTDYLTRPGDWKGYFNLTLQPRPDKYYILGVVSDPIASGEVTDKVVNGIRTQEEELRRKIEFTAQFAKRFEDFVIRIGMLESTFGVGAEYLLNDDKAKITVDAWDFSADESNAEKAHMRVGIDYSIFKNIFISGGIDNLLNENRSGIYVGGGVKFEDEDFKYIFGSSPRIPSR